jgi:pyruvate dehydrogenase E2 component (dihydrolipoamide acetyltransferase)
MPKLGMAMKKGTLKRWLVAEGGAVELGKPLLEVMTEKINAVVESPASGVLGRVVVAPNTELPVGALLALIGEAGDAFPPAQELGQPGRPVAAAAPAAAPEVLASPAARRLARDLGIDIAEVSPSTAGKRITTDDVEAFAAAREAAPPAPPAAGRTIPFTGIRKVVAERLQDSLHGMAQVTISREADVSGLVGLRERLAPGFEAASGIHLTYTDLFVEIVARLLTEHPLLNATLDGDTIVAWEAVHMGVAVALEDGLIVPVIRNSHCRPLREIAADRVELTGKAQAGALNLEEVEGGTFTISNLGSFGADSFTPIVNPPQCAILGIGRIVDKPVVVDGTVQVRPSMWLSLTFDHRLVDGAPAARFLQALTDSLA